MACSTRSCGRAASRSCSDRIATEEEFGEFLRLCNEAGPDCAFCSPGGSRARWEALADALFDEPVDLGDASSYSYDFLIGDATSAMYSPESWGGPDGYGAFFDIVDDAALGDQAAAAAATTTRVALRERLGLSNGRPTTPTGSTPTTATSAPTRSTRGRSSDWQGHRHLRQGRVSVRPAVVVGQRGVCDVAGRPRPLHRSVERPHQRHPSSLSATTSTA